MNSKRSIVALLTGTLFGVGLGIAQMIDPNKIRNFLDIAELTVRIGRGGRNEFLRFSHHS
jgi:hypothetical protein